MGDMPDYVGWLGGRLADPERGPKLNVIPVTNDKVIANHMIQAPVQEGDPRYMGAPQGWFYQSYDENTPDVNLQPDSALSNSRELMAKAELLGDSVKKRVKDFKRQTTYKQKMSNSNILFKNTASGIKVDPNPRRVEHYRDMVLNSSCHQVVAFMDVKDLLGIYSPLGWLAEYHSSGDLSLIQSFINQSVIKRLIITRRRLTNHPDGNNLASSPDYITYDEEEIPKHIISTSDRVYLDGNGIPTPQLSPAWTPSIAQIIPLGQAGSGRGFYLEDFDLFHNVTYGNYEYTVEVDILDGIKKTLEERINLYYSEREKMNEYINLSTVPVTYGDKIESESSSRGNYASRLLQGFSEEEETAKTSEVVRGYYNYKTNEYTDSFYAYAGIRRDQIQRFVRSFIECYKILERTPPTGNSHELHWSQYQAQLIDIFLKPVPGQIDAYISFFDIVASTMDAVLSRGNISKYERTTSGLGASSLDTSKESRIINIKAKIPEMIEAFSRTQIFYEPQVGALRATGPEDTRLRENRRRDSWNTEA